MAGVKSCLEAHGFNKDHIKSIEAAILGTNLPEDAGGLDIERQNRAKAIRYLQQYKQRNFQYAQDVADQIRAQYPDFQLHLFGKPEEAEAEVPSAQSLPTQEVAPNAPIEEAPVQTAVQPQPTEPAPAESLALRGAPEEASSPGPAAGPESSRASEVPATLQQALSAVAASTSSPEHKRLATRLSGVLSTEVPMTFKALPDNQVGAYSPKAGTVTFDESLHGTALWDEAVLHEAVHAATAHAIAQGAKDQAAGKDTPEAKLYKDLTKLARVISTPEDFRLLQGPADAYYAQLDAQQTATLNGILDEVSKPEGVSELLAYGTTNAVFRGYLDALPDTTNKTVWRRLVARIKKFLGLDKESDSVQELLDRAFDLSQTRSGEPEDLAMRSFGSYLDGWAKNYSQARTFEVFKSDEARDLFSKIGTWWFKARLAWSDAHHLEHRFRDELTGLRALSRLYGLSHAQAADWGLKASEIAERVEKWRLKNPTKVDTMNELQGESTNLKINPTIPADDKNQPERVKEDPKLKAEAARLHQMWLSLDVEGKQAFMDMWLYNKTDAIQRMVALIHHRIHNTKSDLGDLRNLFPDTEEENPAIKLRMNIATYDTVQKVHDYWQEIGERMLKEMRSRISEENTQIKETKAAGQKMSSGLEDMRTAEKELATTVFRQYPYFHLGRHGDWYLAFDLSKKPEAAGILRNAFRKAGIGTPMVPYEHDGKMFSRFESQAAAEAALKVVRALEPSGVTGNIKSGMLSQQADAMAPTRGSTAAKVIEVLQSAPAETPEAQAARDEMVQAARQALLDMTPEMSIQRVLAHRKGRGGYEKNMLRNFGKRASIAAFHSANLMFASKISQSFAALNEEVKQKGVNPESLKGPSRAQMVVDEVQRRYAQGMMRAQRSAVDSIRATTSAYFLTSPSFVLNQFLQVVTNAVPEMGARFGNSWTAKAFSKQALPVSELIKDAIAKGHADKGWRGWADAVLDLNAAKQFTKDERELLHYVVASGSVNFAQSTELGRLSRNEERTTLGATRKVATTFGYYSEVYNRVITALVAYHGFMKENADKIADVNLRKQAARDFALYQIDETQLNYAPHHIARMTGKHGFAGEVTPVMTALMQFQFQMVAKMMRDVAGAMGKDVRKSGDITDFRKSKAEAQKAVVNYVATMVGVAGMLGLPGVAVLAWAADSLFGDDKDPKDSISGWRNLVADYVGEDFEKIINHGIFQGVGLDESRIGQQDIIPFTRAITDGRPWQDSFADRLAVLAGAGGSMVKSILVGVEKMNDGDVRGGLETALPPLVRGPVKTAFLASQGYEDASGNKLPMQPGASDYIYTALGYTPAQKEERQEARHAVQVHEGKLNRAAMILRRQIAEAYESGDTETLRAKLADAQEMMQKHPEYFSPASIAATIQRRAKSRAIESATGVPTSSLRGLSELYPLTRFAR